MKRLAVLAIMVLLIPTVCLAESIFPTLTEPEKETVLFAPSYGAMACVEPDSITENPAGGFVVRYSNVSADDYNKFGVYLGVFMNQIMK